MKRWTLVAVTLSTLVCTFISLHQLGWLTARGEEPRTQTQVEVDSDVMLSQSGSRWRESRPHHWRDCMLKQ